MINLIITWIARGVPFESINERIWPKVDRIIRISSRKIVRWTRPRTRSKLLFCLSFINRIYAALFLFLLLPFFFPLLSRNFFREISRVWKCTQGDLIREAGVKTLSVLFKFSISRKKKKKKRRKILFTVTFRRERNNARIAHTTRINLIIRSNSISYEWETSRRDNFSPIAMIFL